MQRNGRSLLATTIGYFGGRNISFSVGSAASCPSDLIFHSAQGRMHQYLPSQPLSWTHLAITNRIWMSYPAKLRSRQADL
jgi:hypothetical protein